MAHGPELWKMPVLGRGFGVESIPKSLCGLTPPSCFWVSARFQPNKQLNLKTFLVCTNEGVQVGCQIGPNLEHKGIFLHLPSQPGSRFEKNCEVLFWGIIHFNLIWHHYEVRKFPKGSSSYPGITYLWGKKMRFLIYLNIKKMHPRFEPLKGQM